MTFRCLAAALLASAAVATVAPAAVADPGPWLCVPVERRDVLHVTVREMELCFLAG